jgi:polar amino acid transport system substrate-binding protein
MHRMFQCFAVSLAACATVSFAGSLPIATGDDYAPYAGKSLPEGGMTTNLVKEAFKTMKQDVKIDWLPWSQGYDSAKGGQHAATFPYSHSAERDKDFLYSDSLFDVKLNVFAKPGSNLVPSNMMSFNGKTQCIPDDWAPSPKFAPLVKSGAIKREQAKDLAGCAKLVVEGRADFFNSDPAQGADAIKAIGAKPTEIAMVPNAVDVSTLHLIATKANPKSAELISNFNTALRDLKAKGVYDKIVAQYK